jgi:hypothetical protein
MYIRQLNIRHFRGFSDILLKPNGNVVLMGEPGAGRSDLINAISKILDSGVIRAGGTTELDFHQRNTAQPIEISIVIGGLGSDLEQHFFDYLEVWNIKDGELIEESETPDDATSQNHEWVLRLAYRGQWLADQERCDEIVYYPKYSDPTSQSFRRASIADIGRLGFTLLHYESGRILDLGSRSTFRKIVQRSPGDDFTAALSGYVDKIADAAAQFTASSQDGIGRGYCINARNIANTSSSRHSPTHRVFSGRWSPKRSPSFIRPHYRPRRWRRGTSSLASGINRWKLISLSRVNCPFKWVEGYCGSR